MNKLVLDPGNSTGWVIRNNDNIIGGTVLEDHLTVAQLIKQAVAQYDVELIVFETFQLYPGKANKMMWNSFYPCEVIGVIKETVQELNSCATYPKVQIIGLSPSVKKYAGTCKDWTKISICHFENNIFNVGMDRITEHTRDAYRLLTYYELNY